jgi:hypothetical protein
MLVLALLAVLGVFFTARLARRLFEDQVTSPMCGG